MNPKSKGKFIVGSIHKTTGLFSVSQTPARHNEYLSAHAEAQRLAAKHPEKNFVVLEIKAAFAAVDVIQVEV